MTCHLRELILCVLLAFFSGLGLGSVYFATLLGADLPWFPLTAAYAVDGNTIEISALIHVDGISVPQLDRNLCPEETALARRAHDRVKALLAAGHVRLKLIGENQYGQITGHFTAADRPLAPMLLVEKLAKPAQPGTVSRWCPGDAQAAPLNAFQRMLALQP
jgi:endonuclease YncB( thermonuclease family)